MLSLNEAMGLARKHLKDARDNARAQFCIACAETMMEHGNIKACEHWILEALIYLVGVLHHDYQRAALGRRAVLEIT